MARRSSTSSTPGTRPPVSADRVLVIDAGTSALRALIVGVDGAVSPVAAEPWRTVVPDDAAPFGREFVPAAVAAALARLLDAAAPHRDHIAGIAFTGQREGLAFVAEDGAAIFAAPNVDARASAEGIAIDTARAADVYATTGHLPSLMQAPAKLAWLRAHRPHDAARVRYVLPLADWLANLLTGAPAISRSLAAENGLLDVTTCAVAAPLLASLGFAPALVPPILDDGALAGAVASGPFAGVPVALCGADTQCALVGMGAIDAGAAGVPAGWSAPVQCVTAAPIFDAQRRTWTGTHVASNRWILESNAGETGRVWQWACALLRVAPEEASRLAAAAPPGAHDAMAVIGARSMRAGEMNAGMGALTFPLPLVMSAPERGDVLRSVLEATAYAIRANLEQIEEIARTRIGTLRLGGGMSRAAVFAQIVADVVDRPVEVAASAETSALGAAALASAALGLHASLDAAVATMTGGRRALTPDLAVSAAYEDYYARWCALSDEAARLATEIG
jgi:sugar (pentulose or hexulose) kinase